MVDPPATLTVTTDFGGSTGTQTGVFEFGAYGSDERPGSIEHGIDDNPLLDNSFDQVLGLFGDENRQSISLDLGAGQQTWSLQASLNHGTIEGTHPQWGSSDDPADGPNEHTATGADPIVQGIVFARYFTEGTTDSRSTATLEYGPYSTSGFLAPLEVAVRNPSWEIRTTGRDVQVSCELVVTSELDNPIDLGFLKPWG